MRAYEINLKVVKFSKLEKYRAEQANLNQYHA